VFRRQRSGASLRSFLFARFDRQMVPDGAAGDCAQDRMMMRKMSGDGSDGRAFETSRIGWRHGGSGKQKRSNTSGGKSLHVVLPSIHSLKT
jgi:hypothetical protein